MLEGKVIPVLFGLEISDLSGPLSQFQAQKMEQSGVMEVVKAINTVSESKTQDKIVEKLVPSLWPNLKETLEQIPTSEISDKHARPQHEILEELVTGVRGISTKISEIEPVVAGRKKPYPRKRLRRIHPGMVEDMMIDFGEQEAAPVSLLVLAGMLREDYPWIAEILVETYREIRDSNPENIEKVLTRLQRIFRQTMRLDLFHDYHGPLKDILMLAEELPMMLEILMHRFVSRKSKPHIEEDE